MRKICIFATSKENMKGYENEVYNIVIDIECTKPVELAERRFGRFPFHLRLDKRSLCAFVFI